jgi:hypothetical protein
VNRAKRLADIRCRYRADQGLVYHDIFFLIDEISRLQDELYKTQCSANKTQLNLDDCLRILKEPLVVVDPSADDKYSDLEIGDTFIAGYIDDQETT